MVGTSSIGLFSTRNVARETKEMNFKNLILVNLKK